MVWLEIIVVLGAIFFGIRQGGIGIGLCGGLGLAILTLGFGLPMGSPPVDVILIIMTVVVAASALQAAGGMDYLVRLASNFMRRNPKYINIIDRKSTRLNSQSHSEISYAVFCLKKKKTIY